MYSILDQFDNSYIPPEIKYDEIIKCFHVKLFEHKIEFDLFIDGISSNINTKYDENSDNTSPIVTFMKNHYNVEVIKFKLSYYGIYNNEQYIINNVSYY